MSVKEFLDRPGRIYSECGWHHPMVWHPRLNKREKGSWAPAFILPNCRCNVTGFSMLPQPDIPFLPSLFLPWAIIYPLYFSCLCQQWEKQLIPNVSKLKQSKEKIVFNWSSLGESTTSYGLSFCLTCDISTFSFPSSCGVHPVDTECLRQLPSLLTSVLPRIWISDLPITSESGYWQEFFLALPRLPVYN